LFATVKAGYVDWIITAWVGEASARVSGLAVKGDGWGHFKVVVEDDLFGFFTRFDFLKDSNLACNYSLVV